MVKCFGNWYFQKMSEEEFKMKSENFFVTKVTGIHTEKDLAKWGCEEQGRRDPFDNVQYRWFLITDFKENESILVLKVHHSMADGMAISSMLLAMNMKPDVKDMIGFKPLSAMKWAYIYLALPFISLIETFNLLFLRHDRNPIKKSNKITGKRKAAICFEIGCDKIKVASK